MRALVGVRVRGSLTLTLTRTRTQTLTLALALARTRTRTLTSLYPGSAQVVCSPGCTQCYLPAEGKGGVTLSVDAIGSARNVLLSAGKPAQARKYSLSKYY